MNELSTFTFSTAKWILLVAVSIILSPHQLEQPARAWRTAFLAAITVMLFVTFCDGHNAWLWRTGWPISDRPMMQLLSLYTSGGSAMAAILTAFACRWGRLHQQLLFSLAIVFLVTPRSLSLLESRPGFLLHHVVALLTWQLAIAAPLIALVWMSHLARRQHRDARGEI